MYKYNDVCRATADSSLAGQALTSPAIITPASAYNLVDTKYKNKFTKQRVSFAFENCELIDWLDNQAYLVQNKRSCDQAKHLGMLSDI